jgi:chromosome segregation and condensation protein ScpB
MPELKAILEAVLLAAAEPLALDRLLNVFPEDGTP